MLNQPPATPTREPRGYERVEKSDLRKRADDAEYRAELKRINEEYCYD